MVIISEIIKELKYIDMNNLEKINHEELKTINGGSETGYNMGYRFTKGMMCVVDGIWAVLTCGAVQSHGM